MFEIKQKSSVCLHRLMLPNMNRLHRQRCVAQILSVYDIVHCLFCVSCFGRMSISTISAVVWWRDVMSLPFSRWSIDRARIARISTQKHWLCGFDKLITISMARYISCMDKSWTFESLTFLMRSIFAFLFPFTFPFVRNGIFHFSNIFHTFGNSRKQSRIVWYLNKQYCCNLNGFNWPSSFEVEI